MDLRRETNADHLRLIAVAQQVQIEQLVRMLRAKCEELAALKGNEAELQQTLALVEELTRRSQEVTAGLKASDGGAEAEAKGEPKKRGKHGPSEQPMLPEIEREFVLDEADLACRACGGTLQPMTGQFEESEMVDVVEVRYELVKVKQQKYTCRCGGCVETAPGPERVAPGGRYSLDFAVKVAVDKYVDHIPLARQERILRRHGLKVTTQTLWDQLALLGRRLEQASKALLSKVLSQPVIGLDQTGWPRLEGDKGTPWQMWALTAPNIVVHRIKDDKSAATFRELLGGYAGVVVCDALKTHEAGARGNVSLRLAGCWAHVFRKYKEAEPNHPEAARALAWIGELYAIDARAEGDLEHKAQLRRTESTKVLEAMKSWLWQQASLKTLSIGNAAAYTVANWDRLCLFVEDARIPLDNNATERAIRGPVVGRKNHYGSKSVRGTEVAALFYTLVETAKLAGVDPARYLREAALADARGEVLLPDALPQATETVNTGSGET